MKHKGMVTIGLLLFVAASAQAVTIPVPLPAINISTTPSTPTSSQTFTLSLSGQWPDNCPPDDFNVRTVTHNALWIDLLLPGANTCAEPTCEEVVSAYQVNVTVGPLPAGTYTVYARAVACSRVGSFERIGRLTIGTPAGGPPPEIPGPFQAGDRVVLLEDNPPEGEGLMAGQAGTVICCDSSDCTGQLLISWDFYRDGKADTGSCVPATVIIVPPGSTTLMDPNVVLLGRHFNACGTIRQVLEDCIVLDADDGNVFNVVDATGVLSSELSGGGAIQFGDRVRIRGLLNTTPPEPNIVPICPQRAGDIYNPIVSLCAAGTSDGCCSGTIQPGDRVMLLVDNPIGLDGRPAVGLLAGTKGTVICCGSGNPQMPVFVSWDGFTNGNNTDVFCNPPIVAYPPDSGWWVGCGQIALVNTGQPAACADNQLTVDVGDSTITITRNPECTGFATFAGCEDVTLDVNFRAKVSVTVIPVLGAAGTWEAWATPDIIGPGTSTTKICVRVTGLNVDALPAGEGVPVARITVLLNAAP